MRLLGVVVSGLLFAGCAVQPAAPLGPMSCQELMQAADRDIEKAGVRDGGAYKVPGFAWARSNRFLASYAEELTEQQQADWLAELRALDRGARVHEWRNLNSPDWPLALQLEVERCAEEQLSQVSAQEIEQLRSAVQVPDDYSLTARTLGVYPLTAPFLRLGVAGYQADVHQRFDEPWAEAAGQWNLWSWPQTQPMEQDWRRVAYDDLGRPMPSDEQLARLFQQHAPSFLIDERAEYDRPGQPGPKRQNSGAPTFEAIPTLYWLPSWTRFKNQVFLQLNYMLWFSQRPPESSLDFYAGDLDGLIWRTTLDAQGRVLLHDTVHACGCYHYLFPAQNQPRVAASSWLQEPLMLPQGQVPWENISVVLESGTHYVRRIVPQLTAERLAQHRSSLQISAYVTLLSQDRDDASGSDSLFAPDGLVVGSERLERYWLWPSGVVSPGAMRQWGRHAIAFIGKAHFDDPFMLERVFVALKD